MVAPGGAVCFHDTLPRPDYGVDRVFRDIRAEPGCRWIELAQTTDEYGGIGVIWPA